MVKKAIILMADKGHDPTETVEAYDVFKKAGLQVDFATENGVEAECDGKMLTGWTQKLLGATKDVVQKYDKMKESKEFKSPLTWKDDKFSLSSYDLVYLPGGHEKGVRQIIESESVHRVLFDYFELCRKSAEERKSSKTEEQQHCLGAICHGPMVLCNVKDPKTNQSVLYNAKATALPAMLEGAAFHLTKYFLGDYYKTYGYGSENVEVSIQRAMKDPKSQWKSSISSKPFIVEDEDLNLITGRFPPDARLLAERMVKVVGV